MKLLRDALCEAKNVTHEELLKHPFVVSCYYCGMTMWMNSDSAHVDENENITCGGCSNGKE